jgi:GT2 family glycosyltransferase
MNASPRISVVVPTYNRRPRLARVLGGLDQQSAPPSSFEVIVIDDGSKDDTWAWLSGNKARAYAVTTLRQENGGPARARNAGIAAAAGVLILFLDDDVEPTRDLIQEHLASHEAERNVIVMGPLSSLEHYRQPWVAWEQAKIEQQYAAMTRGDWEPSFRQFWTGNASVPKADLEAVGGFDASFNRAEDIELGRRLHQRGMKFRFNPRARGLHHAERSLEAWVAMHESYGRLEVQIFGSFGNDELVDLLAHNWGNLHPATRWLVRRSLGRSLRHTAAAGMLKGFLRLGEALGKPVGSAQACGALANLAYWQASADAIGRDVIESVFQRADALKREREAEPATAVK